MPIFNLDMRMDRIGDSLTYVKDRIKLETASGRTDLNKGAEDFYCGLMNTAFGWNLQNLNALRMDFPAIDLEDAERGICVQVTSTEGRNKVSKTLEKFFAHGLFKQYSRLIVLIIGDKPIYRDPFQLESGFDFAPDRDIWDTKKLLAQIRLEGLEAAERVEDYLQKHLNLPRIPAPLLHLPAPSALPGNAFVGRKDKLAELAEKLADGSNAPILLSGLGGMGKTALVAQFCAGYTGGNVYFVRFRENFTQTVTQGVAAGIPGYNERKPDGARDYAEAMALLGQCSREDILVIDNADEPQDDFEKLQTDPAWGALRQLPLRLILTTRCDVPGAIRVKRMDNGDLHRFFENQELSLSAGQMDDLIEAVQGHTMMVDLMARTLKRTRTLTVEKLLAALRKGNLPGQSYRTVAVERNGEVTHEAIYEHLRRLFNVAEISEDARVVLRNMVLLPEGGMDIGILEAVLGKAEFETLNQQIDQGWLTFDEETRFVTIHPVIRLVCRQELKPDNDSCEDFLDAVLEGYDPTQYDAARFRQLAELFSQAADLLQDPEATWALMAGRLWSNLGQAENAVRYEQRLIDVCKENNDDPEWKAIVYNNLGNTCLALGDYDKALEYTQISLDAWKKVRSEDHPDMAIPYNNLGLIHCALGSYEESIACTLKALQIQEASEPENFYNLGRLHNNLGQTYFFLAEYTKALEHALKAIELSENELPGNHPELGTLCNNAGLIYSGLGDYSKSLEYSRRALEIWENTLPDDHPDRAKALNNLGQIYRYTGRLEEARKNTLRAAEIWEKVLPENHPDLGLCYGNLGETYFGQENFEKSRTYTLKALGILERALPSDHPNLAMLYHNLGMICVEEGKPEEGVELLQKALKIWRNVLPAAHPNLGMGYGSMGYAYEMLGDQNRALRYKLAAAQVYEKALPGDHATLMKVYKDLGNTFASQGRHRSAILYKRKALEIYEKQHPEDGAELAALYSSVGFSCFKAGDLRKCRKYALRALEIARQCLPKDDKNLEIYLKNAAVVLRMIEERKQSAPQEPTE